MKEKEIYVGPSDKGKGMVVMSLELYHQMSVVHTLGDQEITWKDLEDIQKEVRGHSRALAKIVRLGDNGSNLNQARCYDNMSSWACDVPVLRCVAKTHKAAQNGVPKSRPIVGASHGLSTAIGELISDIIEP